MQHLTAETFDQNARDALHDPVLHGALRNLADNFVDRRKIAIASVDDWEGLRERARAIKEETLLHLDKYLAAICRECRKSRSQIPLGARWERSVPDRAGSRK